MYCIGMWVYKRVCVCVCGGVRCIVKLCMCVGVSVYRCVGV